MQDSDFTGSKEKLKITKSSKVPPEETTEFCEGWERSSREAYTLHLADTTLILSQRNSEWCGHGPILEQDIAITNISLDLLGQARNFYQYAANLTPNPSPQNGEGRNTLTPTPSLKGEGAGEVTENSLAYLRTEREYKNLLLVEQPNSDWGQTILRQYLYSQFQYLLYEKLQNSNDEQLAAIAAKALKETTYHLRWSREWVIRLGDGTPESHQRMLKAIDELWRYTGEMFEAADYETMVDVSLLKNDWSQKVNDVFAEATLPVPENVFMQTGGKKGMHTEHLGYILTELQYLQRTYPGCEW
ncbi:MAG: phenylacetate-CoA oxygenase subunit PaaC [Chitinophagaceae bacterium]|nr:phenylacetate-CoA oxygenase subunit PaaC [Chitinophagaceae bacterium]